MKLRAEQLTQHLQKQLGLIYVISGEEPLLMQGTLALLYDSARQRDFQERIIIETDHADAWQRFMHERQHLSLFSSKRVVECRLKPGKIGDLGSKALIAHAQQPPADILLLVVTPKLTPQQQAAQWYKALDKAGYTLQLWPIPIAQFPTWLRQRLQQAGLQVDAQGLQLLATHVEGNLLAAAQEIEKLQLLYCTNSLSVEKIASENSHSAEHLANANIAHSDKIANTESLNSKQHTNPKFHNDKHTKTIISLTAAQIANAITGNNRFDIFNLVDSVLSGDLARSLQILHYLRGEGSELPLVLWGLAREIRTLSSMAYEINRGVTLSQVLQKHSVWEQRKAIMQRALQRHSHTTWLQLIQLAAQVDRMIKGITPGNPWDEMQQLCAAIVGKTLFPIT